MLYEVITISAKVKATIERDTDRDNFMSADQAVEYGLVDAVLTKRD